MKWLLIPAVLPAQRLLHPGMTRSIVPFRHNPPRAQQPATCPQATFLAQLVADHLQLRRNVTLPQTQKKNAATGGVLDLRR